MISANELRIGNKILINIAGLVREVTVDTSVMLDLFQGKHLYKPIPLTEEWLLKFGFVASTQYHIKYEAPHWYMIQKSFGGTFVLKNIDTGYSVKLRSEINYVHQLQNLIFALTGKELILKG